MSEAIEVAEKKSRLGEIQLAMNEGPKLVTVADAWTLANAYHAAGMTPRTKKGPMSAHELMIVFMTGAELGFGPSWSIRNVTTFNGMPMVHSDGPISLVLRSGLMEWQKSGYTGKANADDYTAWFEAKRKGDPEPVRREFSVLDAKTASLWDKDIWRAYGRVRMLMMRARAFVLRDLFGDVIANIAILEEHQGDPEPDDAEPTVGSAGLLSALKAEPVESVEPEPEDAGGSWEPTPEELEEIRAREIAEADGLFGDES